MHENCLYVIYIYIWLKYIVVPLNIWISGFGPCKIFRLVLVPHFSNVTNVSPWRQLCVVKHKDLGTRNLEPASSSSSSAYEFRVSTYFDCWQLKNVGPTLLRVLSSRFGKLTGLDLLIPSSKFHFHQLLTVKKWTPHYFGFRV